MEKGEIIQELIKAYAGQLETVENYIAASVNLHGGRGLHSRSDKALSASRSALQKLRQ
jgi:hypothetical protein